MGQLLVPTYVDKDNCGRVLGTGKGGDGDVLQSGSNRHRLKNFRTFGTSSRSIAVHVFHLNIAGAPRPVPIYMKTLTN